MSAFGILVTVVGVTVGIVGGAITLWTVIKERYSRREKLDRLKELCEEVQSADSPQSKARVENQIKKILAGFSMRDYTKDQQVAAQVDWYFDHLGEIRRTRDGREASSTGGSQEEAQEDSEAPVITRKGQVHRGADASASQGPERAVRTEPLSEHSRATTKPATIETAKAIMPARTDRMLEFPIKEFFKQPRSLFGAGAYEQAGPEAAQMGLRHVLFVTSGLWGTGIIDECKTNFENAGVSVTVYDKVESNPKDYNVMDAYKTFTDAECDGFVSIGGGSSHDCTKGAGWWRRTTGATSTGSRA